jgi:hypothetical protein
MAADLVLINRIALSESDIGATISMLSKYFSIEMKFRTPHYDTFTVL